MTQNKVDVLLVGGGIMSATLGSLLQLVDPNLSIVMVEQLGEIAHESSNSWNNAGTGHAGYCELNYTPQAKNGDIDIKRALSINAAFEVSLQYWSYLVNQSKLPAPEKFINKTPHLSVVWGDDDIAFLKKRHALLSQHPLFAEMQYSEDTATLTEWMPLVMKGRNDARIAATRVDHGTDIDFGTLTRHLVSGMQKNTNFSLLLNHQVKTLKQDKAGLWHVAVKDAIAKHQQTFVAKFVFLGAGGGALPLLQKTNIPESKGYGGFPVSGQWLVCNNEAAINTHFAKVYGKAAIGAPPMSVPHLDTRLIEGKPALLFGPYAGFTTKFLKRGSKLDLLQSVKANNVLSMLAVGKDNMDLTRYLIGESLQKHKDRMRTLRQYYPDAKDADWSLAHAGKRVQIIKQCDVKGGKLEFGTEIVTSKDGSVAALLGASPGASVSVQAMLDVMQRCFKDRANQQDWQARIKTAIPSFGGSLIDDTALLKQVRTHTLNTLHLL